MLDEQHQKVGSPANARTVHKGPLQKRLEEDLCGIIPLVPTMTLSVKGLNCSELNCSLRITAEPLSQHCPKNGAEVV